MYFSSVFVKGVFVKGVFVRGVFVIESKLPKIHNFSNQLKYDVREKDEDKDNEKDKT